MNNINVLKSSHGRFGFSVLGFCLDADNSNIYILSSDYRLFKSHLSDVTQVNELVSVVDQLTSLGHKFPQDDDEIVHCIEYVVQTSSVLLIFKSGLVVQVLDRQGNSNSYILVEPHNTICSAKLSPDQQLLALVTIDHEIHLWSLDSVKIANANASTTSESLHKPVGVGWGSKETQFFGLDGRPSKEQKPEQELILSEEQVGVAETIKSSREFIKFRQRKEQESIIDWRGDGQYLASLTYISETNKHCLKVWNRNLELQYMSEQLVALERGILSWIPNGQYVCCAQRRDDTINEIVMFEKNGLVHQRFVIPRMLDNVYIRDVVWSPSSNTLALIVNQFYITDGRTSFKPILFLYTISNFHYYLKYSTYLDKDQECHLKWDPNDHNRLHITSSSGNYTCIDLSFEIDYAKTLSTVAVADSHQLKLTPMDLCNIPPPMSAVDINLQSPIYRFCLDTIIPNNIVIVTLDSQLIHLSSCDPTPARTNITLDIRLLNQPALPLQQGFKSQLVRKLERANDYQEFILINNRLLALEYNETKSSIVSLDLNNIDSKFEDLFDLQKAKVICIRPIYQGENVIKELCVITSSGQKKIVNLPNHTIVTRPNIFTSLTSYNLIFAEAFKYDNKDCIISLGQDHTLRLNERVIISNSCTSVRAIENYLVYTLSDSTMHFVLLKNLLHEDHLISESWSQPVESGATLVLASERSSKVVLQMPRGNLEILHPRLLVLLTLVELLDQNKLLEATRMARRHRVNLNFIYDYLIRLSNKPEVLLDLVRELGIADPHILTLVITELNSGDTVTGQYFAILKQLPKLTIDLEIKHNQPVTTKIQNVHSWLQKAIAQNEAMSEFMQPRLLCLIRLDGKGVREALELVHQLPEDRRIEALKFIMYFIDIDKLFNQAIQTYSTQIAIMVAGVSNKDPKKYLSLLAEFDKIKSPKMRCFEVDMHVGDYESALRNIYEHYLLSQDDEEVHRKLMELLDSKHLYKAALQVISEKEPPKSLSFAIWSKYAGYLLEKRYYSEAGIAYSKAIGFSPNESTYNSALRCYALCDEWERSLAIYWKAKQFNLKVKLESLVNLAEGLSRRGLCLEALTLSGKLEGSAFTERVLVVNLMNQGKWWLADALSLTPSVKTEIQENILESHERLLKELDTDFELVKTQYDRLKYLISTYQTRKLDFQSRDKQYISDSLSTVDGSEMSSNLSDASDRSQSQRSNSHSLKTRKSTSSTKSKAARKRRINLNVGSKHEDMALILELQSFVSRQRDIQMKSAQIAAAGYEYTDFSDAKRYQLILRSRLQRSFDLAKDICETLWPISPLVDQQYSLYRRFSNIFDLDGTHHDNVDFQVLIRPELPKEMRFFDL